MPITFTSDFESKISRLAEKAKKQARFAGVQALNDVAKIAADEIKKDMGYGFDRPTPWAMRGIYVSYAKTGGPMVASVSVNGLFTNKQQRSQLDTLSPHFQGGQRRQKAFETAFQRIGLMPKGWFAVPGSAAQAVGALDGYGNLKQSFIVMLMSYFQAFGEQGYRANATDKSRARRAKMGKVAGARSINGVVYFVSRGKGNYFGNGSWRNGRMQHLRPGIWAKTGIHGADVKPVVMFVSSAQYRIRLDMEETSRQAMYDHFSSVFDRRFANAIATAR